VASLLAQGGYIDAPAEVLRRPLTGRMPYAQGGALIENPDFQVYHRYAANFPWRSQAIWMGRALAKARLVGPEGAPAQAFRPAHYARAAQELGIPYPLVDVKEEGAHDAPWVLEQASAPIPMGVEKLFDGANLEQEP
jgi:nitrate/nitrite transport system substrate-binding protein